MKMQRQTVKKIWIIDTQTGPSRTVKADPTLKMREVLWQYYLDANLEEGNPEIRLGRSNLSLSVASLIAIWIPYILRAFVSFSFHSFFSLYIDSKEVKEEKQES